MHNKESLDTKKTFQVGSLSNASIYVPQQPRSLARESSGEFSFSFNGSLFDARVVRNKKLYENIVQKTEPPSKKQIAKASNRAKGLLGTLLETEE